ncbi:MYXO-CTERM sorting domain-containing protein, partial [Streptomyces cacaoi]
MPLPPSTPRYHRPGDAPGTRPSSGNSPGNSPGDSSGDSPGGPFLALAGSVLVAAWPRRRGGREPARGRRRG